MNAERKIRTAIRIYAGAGLITLGLTGFNCYWAAGASTGGMVAYSLAALLFLAGARTYLVTAWNLRKAWNNPIARYLYLVRSELGTPRPTTAKRVPSTTAERIEYVNGLDI